MTVTDYFNFMLTEGHVARVNAMTFDPESKNIVSCANDKVLNVIDVQTGTRLYCTTLEHEPISLIWFGALLLVGDEQGNLSTWDLQGVAPLRKIRCHDGPLTTITVSVNNEKVITGGKDKKVIVWECF